MQLTVELCFPAPVTAVGAMLADEEFWRWQASGTGAVVESVDVTWSATAPVPGADAGSPGGGFAVAQRRSIASGLIPGQLRGVVGDRLEIRLTEVWEPESDGMRTGTVALEITGAPVRFSGTMTLVPDAEGCRHVYDGQITASIPLFAGALEDAAATAVRSALIAVEDAGRRWLREPH